MRLWQLAALFVVSVLIFLLVSVPLDAALRWSGAAGENRLAYERAEGTIWSGRLRDARYGAVHLGTVTHSVRPLDLLMGRLGLSWSVKGRALQGRGAAALGLGGQLVLRDTVVQSNLAAMPLFVDLTGALDVTLPRLTLSRSGCLEAEGEVRTAARLQYDSESWKAPDLQGTLTCADRTIVLPLSGASGSDAVDLRLAVEPSQTYEARVVVKTEDDRIVNAMQTLGFDKTTDGYQFVQAGRLGAKGL